MKKLLTLVLAVAMVLSMCSAAFAESAAPAPVKGGCFVTSETYDPPPALNGNVAHPSGFGNGTIHEWCFERLFDYVAVPEKIYQPRMAVSFVNEGNTTTVTLGENRKWSDGTAITAEDVVTTYHMRYLYDDRIWKYLEKVEAVDDVTVKFTWKTVTELAVILAFNQRIEYPTAVYGKWATEAAQYLDKREYSETDKEFKNPADVVDALAKIKEDALAFMPDITTAITGGAYKVTSATASEVLMDRNEYYWNNDNVYVDQIKQVRYVSSESWMANVQSGVYTGEPHGATPDVFAELEKMPNFRLQWTADLGQPTFEFNIQKYPMNIKEVRQAVLFAVNREDLLAIAEPGTLDPDMYCTGLSPMWRDAYADQAFLDTLTKYEYNPDKAVELLESIGWTKGSDGFFVNEKGEPVEIEVSSMNSWPIYFVCGDAIVEYLNDIGLKATFNAMEIASYWTYIDNGEGMISGDFRSGTRYLGPWEAFRNLYIESANRMGIKPSNIDQMQPVVMTLNDGTEVNVDAQINTMFTSTDEAEIQTAVRTLMQLTNEQAIFMPIGEKWSPMKFYDDNFYYPNTDQSAPEWMDYGQRTMSRQISQGMAYFTKVD